MKKLVILLVLMSCQSEKKLQIHGLNLGKIVDQKWTENKIKRSQTFRQFQTKNGEIIKIKSYFEQSNESAIEMANDSLFLLNEMFQNKPNPYPGQLSQEIGCEKVAHPVISKNNLSKNWSINAFLQANAYFIPKVCKKDQKYTNTEYLWLYCHKIKTLFLIKNFLPVKETNKNREQLKSNIFCIDG